MFWIRTLRILRKKNAPTFGKIKRNGRIQSANSLFSDFSANPRRRGWVSRWGKKEGSHKRSHVLRRPPAEKKNIVSQLIITRG